MKTEKQNKSYFKMKNFHFQILPSICLLKIWRHALHSQQPNDLHLKTETKYTKDQKRKTKNKNNNFGKNDIIV